VDTSDVGTTVRRLDATDADDSARFLRVTGNDGIALVTRVGDGTATRILLRHADGDLDASHVRRMNDLMDAGDMDRADVRRMTEIIESRETDPLIGNNIGTSDLLEIGESADLVDTIGVVSRNGEVRWLSRGGTGQGWEHINQRHISGTLDLESEDATSLFPVGQVVKGETLPDTTTHQEVREMIVDAIKQGDPTQQGQKIRYYFEPAQNGYSGSGIDEMRVIVQTDGSVETAFPLSGESVWRYVPDLNDGNGGFVRGT